MKIGKSLDTLINILSTPDWVSPLVGMSQELAHAGDSQTIVFDRHTHSITAAKRILKRAGIKYWNDQIIDGAGYISVSRADAKRAQRLLE